MSLATGMKIAATAATLLASLSVGCGNNDEAPKQTTQPLQCAGGNACKAMGECKGPMGQNACQGMNNCAAMGFVTAKDKADCDAKQTAAKAQAAKMAGGAKG